MSLFSEDDVVLLKQEELIFKNAGGTRIEVMDDHLAVNVAHHADAVATGLVVDATRHGKCLEEGAALIVDSNDLATGATQEKHLEVGEPHHHQRPVEITFVFKAFANGILQLESRQTGHMKIAQSRKLDIAVHIDKVAIALL